MALYESWVGLTCTHSCCKGFCPRKRQRATISPFLSKKKDKWMTIQLVEYLISKSTNIHISTKCQILKNQVFTYYQASISTSQKKYRIQESPPNSHHKIYETPPKSHHMVSFKNFQKMLYHHENRFQA